MSHGIDRAEAEDYIKMQARIAEYFRDIECKKSFFKVQGLLITGYECAREFDMEVYPPGDGDNENYRFEVWIPVIKR